MSCIVKIQGTPIDLDNTRQVFDYAHSHSANIAAMDQLSGAVITHLHTIRKMEWFITKYELMSVTHGVFHFIGHLF